MGIKCKLFGHNFGEDVRDDFYVLMNPSVSILTSRCTRCPKISMRQFLVFDFGDFNSGIFVNYVTPYEYSRIKAKGSEDG